MLPDAGGVSRVRTQSTSLTEGALPGKSNGFGPGHVFLVPCNLPQEVPFQQPALARSVEILLLQGILEPVKEL